MISKIQDRGGVIGEDQSGSSSGIPPTARILLVWILLFFMITVIFLMADTVEGSAPNELYVEYGTGESGSVNDMATDDDAYYELDEVTGSPGLSCLVNITGQSVSQTTWWDITLAYYYDGSAGHTMWLQFWHFDTSTWADIIHMVDNAAEVTLTYWLEDPRPYCDSGDIRIRVYHSSPGDTGHTIGIDYLDVSPREHITLAGVYPQIFNMVFTSLDVNGFEWVTNAHTFTITGTLTIDGIGSFIGLASPGIAIGEVAMSGGVLRLSNAGPGPGTIISNDLNQTGGEVTGHARDVSIGVAYTAGPSVYTNGILNMGSGAWNVGSIEAGALATITMTSGVFTLEKVQTSAYIIDIHASATIDDNGGVVVFENDVNYAFLRMPDSFNDVYYNSSKPTYLKSSFTVDGDFELNDGVFSTMDASNGYDLTVGASLTVKNGGNITGGTHEDWDIGLDFILESGAECVATDYSIMVFRNLDFDNASTFWHNTGEVRLEGGTNNLSIIHAGGQAFYYLNLSGVNLSSYRHHFRIWDNITIDLSLFAFDNAGGSEYWQDVGKVLFRGNMTITSGRVRSEFPHKWWPYPDSWWTLSQDYDMYISNVDQMEFEGGYVFRFYGRSQELKTFWSYSPGRNTTEPVESHWKYFGGNQIVMWQNSTNYIESDMVFYSHAAGIVSAGLYYRPSAHVIVHGGGYNWTVHGNVEISCGWYYDIGWLDVDDNVVLSYLWELEIGNISTGQEWDVEVDFNRDTVTSSSINIGNVTTRIFYAGFFAERDRETGQMNLSSLTLGGSSSAIYLSANHTINFTSQKGIQSTSDYNMYAAWGTSYERPATLTGVPGWRVDTGEMSDWTLTYLNLTNCHNNATDGQYLTYLGWNVSGNVMTDNVSPVITLNSLLEGMVVDKTTSGLNVNVTVSDLSFLHSIMVVAVRLSDGVEMYNHTWDDGDYGEVRQYTLNITIDVSGWEPGLNAYRIWVNASDAHNSHPVIKSMKDQTFDGKDKAKDMVLEIEDKKVSSKEKIKKIEVDGNLLTFKKGSTQSLIYSMAFLNLDKNAVKNYVEYRGKFDNFKMSHEVDLPKDVYTVTTRFYSPAGIVYLPDSSYYCHLLIGGTYFYSADDWRALRGQVWVKVINETTVDVEWSHYQWREGKKTEPMIDPLSGAINTGSAVVNISVECTAILVSPTSGTTVYGQDWARLNVTVIGINATATISFYRNTSGGPIYLTKRFITTDTYAVFNWTGLSHYRTYDWFVTCRVNGINATGPVWNFTTLSYLNVSVVGYFDAPVEGATVFVIAENGTIISETLTDVNGMALQILVNTNALPITIIANKNGNYAEVSLSSVDGENVTILLHQYSLQLQIQFSMVSNYTFEEIPISAELDAYINDELVVLNDFWIEFPQDHAHVEIYDQFGRLVWSRNYTGLEWSELPYVIRAELNYAYIDIYQWDAENETLGNWVVEWSISTEDDQNTKYYFSGSKVGVICWNETDNFLLDWNGTSEVDGGSEILSSVGHTINAQSPHSSGYFLADVRIRMAPTGLQEGSEGWQLPGPLQGVVDWLANNFFGTNLWVVVAGMAVIVSLYFIVTGRAFKNLISGMNKEQTVEEHWDDAWHEFEEFDWGDDQ